jgi:hypothetical protein
MEDGDLRSHKADARPYPFGEHDLAGLLEV